MSYMAPVADAPDEEGVQGTLCADARGLCVQASGTADPNAAGFFTALVRRAATLAGPLTDESSGGTEGLTVLIETEKQ